MARSIVHEQAHEPNCIEDSLGNRQIRLQTNAAVVADDNGLGELTLDKKKKKKKKAAFVESVSLVS